MSKNKRAKIEREVWEDDKMNRDRQFSAFPEEKISIPMFKGLFRDEIKAMLYVYGDVRHPLSDTVTLVEEIVYTQMCDLLIRTAELSQARGSSEIGLEELLFLLRRDPGKMNRFVARMRFMDSHTRLVPTGSVCDETEQDVDFKFKERRGFKRYKRCADFLELIDDSGELKDWASKTNVDNVKVHRLERAEKQTRDMNTSEYMEYVKLRRLGFTTKKSWGATKKHFRDWFNLERMEIPTQVTEHGWDGLEYLAQETVAELVDKALLVRSETATPLLPCEIEPDNRHLPLYASCNVVARTEILGDTHGNEQSTDTKVKIIEGPLNRKLALTTGNIREAMRRFQVDGRKIFSAQSVSSARRKLLCLD